MNAKPSTQRFVDFDVVFWLLPRAIVASAGNSRIIWPLPLNQVAVLTWRPPLCPSRLQA